MTIAGTTALQRIRSGAYSTAMHLVSASTQPFAAAYGAMPDNGYTASVEATLTTTRSPGWRISTESAARSTR